MVSKCEKSLVSQVCCITMVSTPTLCTTGGTDDSSRDPHPDHSPYDRPSGGGGAPGFRDDKQETVVVRPYPQVHGPPQGHHPTLPQHLPLQQGMPVTVSAPPPHIPRGLPLAFTEGPIKVWTRELRVLSAAFAFSLLYLISPCLS